MGPAHGGRLSDHGRFSIGGFLSAQPSPFICYRFSPRFNSLLSSITQCAALGSYRSVPIVEVSSLCCVYWSHPLCVWRHDGFADKLTQSFSKRGLVTLDDLFLGTNGDEPNDGKTLAVFSIVSLCQLLAGSPEIFCFLDRLGSARYSSASPRTRPCNGFFRSITILLGSGCHHSLASAWFNCYQRLSSSRSLVEINRSQRLRRLAGRCDRQVCSGFFCQLSKPTRPYRSEFDCCLLKAFRSCLVTTWVSSRFSALCCWFRTARTKERVVVSVLIGCSLLLAFGSYTPVYPFLYDWVPAFRAMRFPEKYYYLTFALLVFTGCSWVAANRRQRKFSFAVAYRYRDTCGMAHRVCHFSSTAPIACGLAAAAESEPKSRRQPIPPTIAAILVSSRETSCRSVCVCYAILPSTVRPYTQDAVPILVGSSGVFRSEQCQQTAPFSARQTTYRKYPAHYGEAARRSQPAFLLSAGR